MSKKKIGLICILIVIIIAIIIVIINSDKWNKKVDLNEQTNQVNTTLKASKINSEEESNTDNLKSTIVKQLDDGTLYSLTNEEIKPDIVIGDNYYDTQISDININFSQYEEKTIEIEGMYLSNESYTFVGRYSTSNLCQYCPVGYSYFEYQWKGDKKFDFIDEKEWLKIKGKLKKGDDNGTQYYYIDVLSLEVMNEKGKDTVNN